MADPSSIHATCILLGEAGILIRGPSGSGKSTLARDLVRTAFLAGAFARLVGDDRVSLAAHHGRVVARVPDSIAGWVEIFGRGLVQVAYEPQAVVRLVVDLGRKPSRWPEPEEVAVTLCGITIPCLRSETAAQASSLVLGWMRRNGVGFPWFPSNSSQCSCARLRGAQNSASAPQGRLDQ
jgi:HPr kinase/phosphorylase